MAQVKGIAVTSRLRFVRERFGEEGLQRLLAELTPEERELIDGHVLPHAWVPYSLFIHVNVAADRLFGDGSMKLCVELGRFSANVSLPTIFKFLYRLGSPTFILSKAARLWSAHYDSGRLLTFEDGPGKIRLRIEGFDSPHRAHCLSVLGWAMESIAISGSYVQFGDETKCRTRGDPCCELTLHWTDVAVAAGEPPADDSFTAHPGRS